MISKDERTVLNFLFENKEKESDVQEICSGIGLSRQIVRRCLTSLQEQKMIGGPPDLRAKTIAMLHDIEPKLKQTDAGFNEHVVLLASIISKADEEFLADELDFDSEFVGLVGSRLRQAGIWAGSEMSPEFYDKIMKNGLNLWLAGAVATGDLMVVGRNENGDEQFKKTEQGLVAGAKLIKDISRDKNA